VGTRSPQDVAAAVIKAIDENRAELDVAPLTMRLGTAFSGLAPGPAAAISRRMGSHEIAASVAERQRSYR
jgi:hypothetical protein